MTSLRVNNVRVQYAAACQTITFKLRELADRDIEPSQQFSGDGVAMCAGSSTNTVKKRASAAGLTLLPLLEDHPSAGGKCIATPTCSWEFNAELLVLNHPSKMRLNYEPVVHISCIQQTAKIVAIRKILKPAAEEVADALQEEADADADADVPIEMHGDHRGDGDGSYEMGEDSRGEDNVEIGNGESALCRQAFELSLRAISCSVLSDARTVCIVSCRFRFLYYPEYILPGESMVIREQSTRGVGTVTAVL